MYNTKPMPSGFIYMENATNSPIYPESLHWGGGVVGAVGSGHAHMREEKMEAQLQC